MQNKFNKGRGESRGSARGESRDNGGKANFGARSSRDGRSNGYEKRSFDRSEKSEGYNSRAPRSNDANNCNSERSFGGADYGRAKNSSNYENRQGGFSRNNGGGARQGRSTSNGNLKDFRGGRGDFAGRENKNEHNNNYANQQREERSNYGRPQQSEERSNYGRPQQSEGRSNYGRPQQSEGRSNYGRPQQSEGRSNYGRPQQSEGRSNYGRPQQSEGRSNYGRPQQSEGRSNYGRPQQQSEERSNYGRPPQQSEGRSNYGRPQQQSEERSNYGRPPQQSEERNTTYGRPQREDRHSSRDGENNNSRYEQKERGERSNDGAFRRDNRNNGERASYGKFNKKFTNDNYDSNAKYSHKKQVEYKKQFVDYSQPMRLNKFLANSGMCSRREADEFIQAGVVSVNGHVVSELGAKVIPDTDQVHFHDQLVRAEKKVYILLNKPKNCVTTAEDTHDRMTVLDLVKNACSERVYPVGRLDRNTTGVLLITNDGDLTSKLTHPKYDKKKIYQITLDKPLSQEDMDKIATGITLEDGDIKADEISYVYEDDLSVVGIEIHSGKNRIVRRIFDYLGYHVIKLDRVYFAGLTKKNLPRGKWRYLSEMEVTMLKMS